MRIVENTHQFGSDGHLVGTFAEPDTTGALYPRVMVLLTNAGIISRSGPHRINVQLARSFAARGIRSLRWDMSGLGDSGRPSDSRSMREQLVADTRAAMDEAQRTCGVARFVMIGFCSGAEAAYYTALNDARLVGIALFDLFTYATWKTHWLRMKQRIRRHGLLSAGGRLAISIMRSVIRPRMRGSAAGGATPSRAEFAGRLSELHDRGTRVLIIESAEADLHNYEHRFRDNFGRFGIVGKVDYAYLRECDHVFTTAEGQMSLVTTAVEWVQRLQVTEIPKRGPVPLGRAV